MNANADNLRVLQSLLAHIDQLEIQLAEAWPYYREYLLTLQEAGPNELDQEELTERVDELLELLYDSNAKTLYNR